MAASVAAMQEKIQGAELCGKSWPVSSETVKESCSGIL
jgi:hypothetical protein